MVKLVTMQGSNFSSKLAEAEGIAEYLVSFAVTVTVCVPTTKLLDDHAYTKPVIALM